MIVSIELKKDEKSIIETARHFKVDFRLEKIEELKKYEDLFLGSSLVKSVTGLSSVSEPCAFKYSEKLLKQKIKKDGFTLTIGVCYE